MKQINKEIYNYKSIFNANLCAPDRHRFHHAGNLLVSNNTDNLYSHGRSTAAGAQIKGIINLFRKTMFETKCYHLHLLAA